MDIDKFKMRIQRYYRLAHAAVWLVHSLSLINVIMNAVVTYMVAKNQSPMTCVVLSISMIGIEKIKAISLAIKNYSDEMIKKHSDQLRICTNLYYKFKVKYIYAKSDHKIDADEYGEMMELMLLDANKYELYLTIDKINE